METSELINFFKENSMNLNFAVYFFSRTDNENKREIVCIWIHFEKYLIKDTRFLLNIFLNFCVIFCRECKLD